MARERGYLAEPGRGKATDRMSSAFLLFVYGTLKRGERAHARFCSHAAFVATGTVRGALHLHPDGYPILVVPQSDVRALGSADPAADAAATGARSAGEAHPAGSPGRWRAIRGEIFAFADPRASITTIDKFEGVTASPNATYQRVLLPVGEAPGVAQAWAYVAAPTASLDGIPPLEADCWP